MRDLQPVDYGAVGSRISERDERLIGHFLRPKLLVLASSIIFYI